MTARGSVTYVLLLPVNVVFIVLAFTLPAWVLVAVGGAVLQKRKDVQDMIGAAAEADVGVARAFSNLGEQARQFIPICQAMGGASCIAWCREGACPHVDGRRWLGRPPMRSEWRSVEDLLRARS